LSVSDLGAACGSALETSFSCALAGLTSKEQYPLTRQEQRKSRRDALLRFPPGGIRRPLPSLISNVACLDTSRQLRAEPPNHSLSGYQASSSNRASELSEITVSTPAKCPRKRRDQLVSFLLLGRGGHWCRPQTLSAATRRCLKPSAQHGRCVSRPSMPA